MSARRQTRTLANLGGVTHRPQIRNPRNCVGFIVRRRLRELAELRAVTSTDCSSRCVFLQAVGQATHRKGCGLPAGGVDTSADSAACCTLRPRSARNRVKSAGWRPAELAAVASPAASFSEGELTAVERPPQVATRFPSRKRGGYLGRARTARGLSGPRHRGVLSG